MPGRFMIPTFSVVAEEIVTIGFSHRRTHQCELGGSPADQTPIAIRYDNQNLPFGRDASDNWELLLATLMISRRW